MSQEMGSSSQKRKIDELEQTKSTHNVLRIAEEPKRVKEDGTEEEKKFDRRRKLMLDVALMKGRLNGLKHIAAGNDDADGELKMQIEDLTIDLKIKTEELEKLEAMNTTWMFKKRKNDDEQLQEARKKIQDLEAMNQALVAKESQSNNELQEVRKKLEDVEAMNQRLIVKERQSYDELQEARKKILDLEAMNQALVAKESQSKNELQETRSKLEDIEAMNRTLIVKEHQSNDELQEARKEIKDLKAMNHSLIVKERQTNDELQETRKKLEDIEAMNQTLLVKERQSNDELQEARKELINVYISDLALIRVKRLGEIDLKPFQDACKKKYSANEADIKACQLCYDWKNKIKDPNWLPFVNVKVGENLYKTNIDENDVKLSSLRNDMGEDVFKAVANALLELKEYDGSGKFPDPELWNFKEGRRATLKEGIQRLCQLMPKK